MRDFFWGNEKIFAFVGYFYEVWIKRDAEVHFSSLIINIFHRIDLNIETLVEQISLLVEPISLLVEPISLLVELISLLVELIS